MTEASGIDPIMAAVAAELVRIDPGCTVGGVLVCAEMIDSGGKLVYGFMNEGLGPATETMLISARLQTIALEWQALPEETE